MPKVAVRARALARSGWHAVLRTAGAGRADGWDRPLVGAGPLGRPPVVKGPAAAAGPVVTVPSPAVTAGPPALLVCGALDGGGLSAFVEFLSQGLPRHGVPASVACPAPGVSPAGLAVVERLRAAGVPVHLVPAGGMAAVLRGGHGGRPFEVANVHGVPPRLVDELAAAGVPVVETLHRTLLVPGGEEAQNASRVRTVIAVSELARRQYLALGTPVPPEAVVTIPNGVTRRGGEVDRQQARRWLGLTDEFLFVSLARFSLQKNTYALAAAFTEVAAARPDVHLLLAGEVEDPVLHWRTARLVARAGLTGRIHLRRYSPHADLLLAAADGFVLDSFFEGWPLATMEALCAGLPVVMAEVGGAIEQVGRDGDRGHLVPNPLGDPAAASWEAMGRARFAPQPNRAALVGALLDVAARRDHWTERRDMLRSHSLERFDPERCLAAHAHVLSAATRNAPATRGIEA